MLDSYRINLLTRNEAGKRWNRPDRSCSGSRLESVAGAARVAQHHLRERLVDHPDAAPPHGRRALLLACSPTLARRYDHKKVSTEEFRAHAAKFLPPKSEDPTLEGFFEQWVYWTGVPAFKLTYSVKGKAPALRVVGTLEQSEVEEDFTALVPVEIQIARGRTITHWVQSGSAPVSFTVPVSQAPSKVLLDPKRAILRR